MSIREKLNVDDNHTAIVEAIENLTNAINKLRGKL